MEIIPSIDLYGGKVVRFVKGDPKTSKIYSDDPVKTAKSWAQEGVHAIHVVDLDSALGTGANNREYISKIADAVKIPVQVGGGIRDFQYASSLLKQGVSRIVVGTLAFKDPEVVKKMTTSFGSEKVAVALDYVGDKVVVRGWTTSTGISIQDAITKFRYLGADIFLMTSVERDGTLIGPDCRTLRNILKKTKVKIIASGGIGTLHDLVHLKKIGVYGAIIGKALYEEKITLRDAVWATNR
ncbi:MAG: 1-(5-phosphoribosyl)-5-[(5-phosphoribosylamino)methylideneamino]imidazole-4-carboxamide isomerase [Thaumarchaeota archaeon]|nr:1-(5-phosphoribosyl)-5-[(5-phosphoribosylamino)methylideneamino]imidazole-4-carboxamide isomerase [Nitrososphaerota archaeon]MCL5317819.1 1-(5-phosphoribosyl)-5-[(5-phosphoribosylamino)methylideneamino]imidazole-4-carboxamide isomerase [Nitrososphaerota archaeon]